MSWQQLIAIVDEQRERIEQQRAYDADPAACPHDGEPLRTGPDGGPYCPFDGWRPQGWPRAGT